MLSCDHHQRRHFATPRRAFHRFVLFAFFLALCPTLVSAQTATAPGGIAGASLWFAASDYTGSTWPDRSGSGLVATAAVAPSGAVSPAALAIDANFNPGVAYNGSTQWLRGALSTSTFANANSYIFGVAKSAILTPTVATFGDVLAGYSAGAASAQGLQYFAGSYGADLSGNYAAGPFTIPAPTTVVADAFYPNAASGVNASVGINGISGVSSQPQTVTGTNGFEIGARTTGGYTGRVFNGSIDEAIFYSNLAAPLSATQIGQIRSYLALKYGITLGLNTQTNAVIATNYTSSGGATVWSGAANATYVYDVAGLGRDAASGLDQRVSHSTNSAASGNALDVTIANGTSISTASQAANTALSSDQTFIMWGDNGGSTTVATVSGVNRMSRVWRTQATGTGSRQLTLQIPSAAVKGLTNPAVLVAADPNFQTALTATPLACGTTYCNATIASFSTASTQYFSFGTAAAAPVVTPTPASTGVTYINEGFSAGATTPNLWSAFGDACLTAGSTATPATSVPACGQTAPQDAIGQGALQLTSGAVSQSGMMIWKTPIPTANGLQFTFDDYAFKGTSPGSEGIAFFLTDASQPIPTAVGVLGGGMGYAGTTTAAGIANAYVGVGLDEYGGFSSTSGGFTGGPGQVAETIAVRGSAATQYQYIGGATNAAGKAASLPFAFDTPTATTRPTNVPTIRGTLTAAGVLSVSIDRHNGSGFTLYYTQSIVGVGGQPAVPANVYFGLTASTGSHYNTHQVTGLTVSALAPPVPASTTTTFVNETFGGVSTAANAWQKYGDSCLTAGTTATATSSLPACGTAAPQDAAGAGTLQLTKTATSRYGIVINKTPIPTANGLQITFTDYAFNGTTPGSEGIAFFLTDASQALPSHNGLAGGGLGYLGTTATNGLPNAYVGVGLDEYGAFSGTAGGYNGGPGVIPETIAVRGSASTNYVYLGGAQNASGKAASLAFALDQPALKTRPATAPTIRATLTAAGLLTVTIDRHDGNGFVSYYSQTIVGVNGEPAVPANVYFGLSASTGSHYQVHQISGLIVTTATAPPVASSTQNPPQIVSSNGSLVFNVTTQLNPTTGFPQYSYAGSAVPPTLRLLPGDTLTVNLTNNLPVPAAGSGYTNNTNLHYHGLHVSPQAPGDDSIDMLAAPGQSLHYLVHIPTNHPPGLYWYHAHAHGEAERQTLSGMSGALIIDGIAAYTPQISTMTEQVLVVRDAPLAGGVLPNADMHQIYAMKWAMQHGVSMHASARGSAGPSALRLAAGTSADRTELHAASTSLTRNPYVQVEARYKRFVRPQVTSPHCIAGNAEAAVHGLTLNGQAQPVLQIAPGEQQFWRLVNAGADTYLDVQIDNTQMQIVALDGVPLSSGVGTPASMTVSHWVVPPASRVEFIVTGPPSGTTAYVRTNCFDAGATGNAMPAAILASINPAAASQAKRAANHAANRPVARISAKAVRFVFHTVPSARNVAGFRLKPGVRTAAGIRAATVSATRTLYYTDQNNINGIAYDPAAAPQFYAQSGTVEEWTISNSANQVHTFHIHQVHFVLEAINGVTQAQQFVMDNVNVPAAGASGPGTVKLLMDFTDPTIIGTFLVHCHILSHEDAGMMAKIRIGTSPPLKLSASSVTFASATAGTQSITTTGGTAPYSVSGCAGVANAAVNGGTVTILPVGAGACILTIADASNPSLTAPVSIQVNAGAAVVTLAPTSVSFTAPTAATQTVAINGGTAPYAATGCANIITPSVTNATLSVSPIAVGTCTLVVTDAQNNAASLSVAVNAPAGGNPLDNLTFHQNTLRNGWYQNETALTTTNVASTSFGLTATLVPPSGMPGFGKVYAQPLYVTNETAVDGKQHNLIVVAGAADQVYAFDETTQAVVWHRDFTNVAAGVRQQLWSDSGCSDVNPDVGIIGTPVIDRARDAIYVVVATMENGVPYTRLHAIGLGTGTDVIAPTAITGSVAMATGGTATINSLTSMNRSALLEANGNIYVTLGSHCDQDASAVHGWVIAYSAATLAETGNLVDLSNANDGTGFYLASPWMGGFGPSADAAGNIYFATGNGPFNGTSNVAMSILKVPGNLNLGGASYFTPIQAATDSSADHDLGSGGVMLLPDQAGAFPHMAIGGGKCSTSVLVGCFKYLLNRDNLGGQQNANAGALWNANTAGGMFGGPAYFSDASGSQHVVYGTGTPLSTYTLGLAPVGLTVQSSANVGCLECRDSGSQPIVSSNGTQAGTAIVWALKTPGNSGGTISLYAFDALNMSHTLFTGTVGNWTETAGASWIGGALVSPLVVNGRVYVPNDGAVTVFGLSNVANARAVRRQIH